MTRHSKTLAAATAVVIGFSVALALGAGAQLTTSPGLTRVVLDPAASNIATGSGTSANPLKVAITTGAGLSGTGSAGSPLTASGGSTVTTSAPLQGTGSAGAPVTLASADYGDVTVTGGTTWSVDALPESRITNLVSDLAAKVPATLTITTTAPLTIDGGSSANLSTGRTLAIVQFSTSVSGVVTSSGAAANFLRGDNTWSTVAQVTAALNQFSSSLQGVVPASGGGTSNFLRADGTWTTPSGNSSHFGDGSDGSATMDGSTSVTCTTRSGSTYTASRSCFFLNLTINSGVTFKPDGWPIYVAGTLANSGDINANGGDASGTTNGTNAISGSRVLPANMSVGNSSSAAPQVFVASSAANGGASVGGAGSAGGAGTSGTKGRGGGGGAGGNNNPFTAQGTAGSNSPSVTLATDVGGDIRVEAIAFRGTNYQGTAFTPGTAGGVGGAGGAGTTGGGVGAAGGYVAIAARAVSGSGTWRAKGGTGGVGQSGGAGIGGAGGGGGGSGGLFVLVMGSGSAPTIDVSGGAGGTGGAGGSGGAGNGGAGGTGGSGHALVLN